VPGEKGGGAAAQRNRERRVGEWETRRRPAPRASTRREGELGAARHRGGRGHDLERDAGASGARASGRVVQGGQIDRTWGRADGATEKIRGSLIGGDIA